MATLIVITMKTNRKFRSLFTIPWIPSSGIISITHIISETVKPLGTTYIDTKSLPIYRLTHKRRYWEVRLWYSSPNLHNMLYGCYRCLSNHVHSCDHSYIVTVVPLVTMETMVTMVTIVFIWAWLYHTVQQCMTGTKIYFGTFFF